MPIDYSGEEGWNSAIKSLGGALFPDPSKAAHSYYYGAEARKAQLESNKLIGQQNAISRLLQTTQPGVAPPAPISFTQPPLTGAAPILAPPANLPMSGVVAPSPGQVVQALPAAIAPLTAGTPPEYSSPSAVSPPAPNTTGSDGSVPGNDPVAGSVHPGSTTDPNGGLKTTGPAASNGSPAPLPPNLNVQGLGTLAAAAGYDASMAGLIGQQAIGEAFRQGRIDAHTYHELLASTGQAAPVGADIAAAAAVKGHELGLQGTLGAARIGADASIKGHEITAAASRYGSDQSLAGTLGSARIQADEKRHEFDKAPQVVLRNGVATFETRDKATGQPAYEPTVAVEQERVRASAAAEENKITEWIDPNSANPTQIIKATNKDGIARGLRAVPKSKDEWDAVLNSAVINAPDPATAQALRDKQAALGAGVPPKTPTENYENQFLIDTRLANAMPVPPGGFPGGQTFTNLHPAGSSPELSTALLDLSNQYFRMDPQTRGDRAASTDKAIQQLADEGYINLQQSRQQGLSGHTSIMKTGYDKNGNPTQQEHFRVDLLDPKTKQPYAAGKLPPITMRRSVSSAIVPPSTQQPPQVPPQTPLPPGAIAVAPAGTADGHIGTSADGRTRVVVRNGFVYPMP